VALGTPIQELLSPPSSKCELIKGIDLKVKIKNGVQIQKLLPSGNLPVEIEKLEFEKDSGFKGSPHISGTREFLFCLRGSIDLFIEGDLFKLSKGDLAVFPGNRKHSYKNSFSGKSEAFSVVCFA
jgi:quercetin dioxygenase-like cupin family protein